MQAISKGLEKLRIIIKQKPCVGVGPLCNSQQVKLMEERNMKPLDLNLAALSARCSKDLELNLAKSLLSEMGQLIEALGEALEGGSSEALGAHGLGVEGLSLLLGLPEDEATKDSPL
ncbi:unnamed protein product [Lactuca saligna]|uniref:Uncharacterized protein n=1 Tax=Lactuca saligna TaxID=75948 RepID=A0AA35YUZ5_LACSI|nr:unnamed protein product [Lactuca saligna]